MRRRFLTALLIFLPAVLATAIWLVFRFGWLPQSIIYLRANLGLLVLALGLILTSVFGGVLALGVALRHRSLQQLAEAEASAATRHHRFLSRLDHELKNPLTAIQVEVANLESEISTETEPSSPTLCGSDERRQTVDRLKHQIARMNHLLIQLRKLGDLESRRLEREPIRLDDLLTRLVEEYQIGQAEGEARIFLDLPQIPWPLPEIEGDVDLLYVALRNLLDNAVKFSDPGDAIQVRAFEDSAHVIVEVADRGWGIPESELPHVWEELYRGEQARGVPGSGLGLAIVKAIVELHSGQITIRSRSEQGTVATLRLPVGR